MKKIFITFLSLLSISVFAACEDSEIAKELTIAKIKKHDVSQYTIARGLMLEKDGNTSKPAILFQMVEKEGSSVGMATFEEVNGTCVMEDFIMIVSELVKNP